MTRENEAKPTITKTHIYNVYFVLGEKKEQIESVDRKQATPQRNKKERNTQMEI